MNKHALIRIRKACIEVICDSAQPPLKRIPVANGLDAALDQAISMLPAPPPLLGWLSHTFDIAVDDELARFWKITPPAGIERIQDLEAICIARAGGVLGQSIEAWEIRADWHADDDFLACALPKSLLMSVQASQKKARRWATSCLPYSIRIWNQALSSKTKHGNTYQGILCFDPEHGGSVTLIGKDKHCLQVVRIFPLDSTTPSGLSQLAAAINTYSLQTGLPLPDTLQLHGDTQHLPPNLQSGDEWRLMLGRAAIPTQARS